MKQVRREHDDSKEDFMFHLYNNLGDTNVSFCYNYYKDGEKFYSRWIKYEDLFQLSHRKRIDGMFDTKKQFIKKVTHRTVLDVELLYDIDDLFVQVNGYKHHFKDMKAKTRWVAHKVRQEFNQKPVVYDTGSRGYHVSIILPWLRQLTPHMRSLVKQDLLSKYGGDMQKSSNRCMIAFEGELHHKSGVRKHEVDMLTLEKVKVN